MRFKYRASFVASATILLVLGLFGISGLMLRARVTRALAATQQAYTDVKDHDLGAGCAAVAQAATAWNSAATLSRPLAPFLHRLRWVPSLGSDLRIAPELIALAHGGTAAGAATCTLLAPVYEAKTGPERLAVAMRQVTEHAHELATIRADLARAQAAWVSIAPQIDGSMRLAPYRHQLQALGEQLPVAIEVLEAMEHAGPHLPWLLGLDAPRRYLLVSQNPFEMRPTGGFMGIVCVVRIHQVRLGVDGCKPSEAYATPAPADISMPFPYTQYLRLGRYYLRDANWSPDFPTTARTLQWFWDLNRQNPVDGVIALDPYALVPLLEATGPLTLDDGTLIRPEQIVDTIHTIYYDRGIYRDKQSLGRLLPAMLDRLQRLGSLVLPRVVLALRANVTEKHLLVALNHQALQAVIASHGWDGGLHPRDGDVLRIVEADVGYGKVNAFVDRLTHYDVALDDQGTPLTATLTLTYTNRYSLWAETTTSHEVYGKCADPQTLQLERRPGCYANYLRVYVPKGSRLLSTTGFGEVFDADQRYERTVFGGYLLIHAGEQRVVQLQYLLPEVTPGSLLIEKQPGTLAPPILVTMRDARNRAEFWTSGRTDLTLVYRAGTQGLMISGPADSSAREAFVRQVAFADGLTQWQRGYRTLAVRTWQDGDVLDRAIDHAQMLAHDGSAADALVLLKAIGHAAPGGRAAFEQATLLEAQGDAVSAGLLYQQAAQSSHPLAQLSWIRYLVATGQPLPDRQQLAQPAATRRWLRTIDAFQRTGALSDATIYLEALIHVQPNDRELALRHADFLLASGQRAAALPRYAALAAQHDLWGLLAGARQAHLAKQHAAAVALYRRALPLATTYTGVFRIARELNSLGDATGALWAYEKASALSPQSISALVAAGDMLRRTDPAAARKWYERAQRADPAYGQPDFALGTLLLESGDAARALPLLEAAVEKEPDVHEFREALDRARALDQKAVGRKQ